MNEYASENDIKQLEPHIKRLNISSTDEISQSQKKASTQKLEKMKTSNTLESQSNKNTTLPAINILPLIEEENVQTQSGKRVTLFKLKDIGQKKRKAGAIDDISQEVSHDKDLKKIKLTQFEEKIQKTSVIEIEDDDEQNINIQLTQSKQSINIELPDHSDNQPKDNKKRPGRASRGKASNGNR